MDNQLQTNIKVGSDTIQNMFDSLSSNNSGNVSTPMVNNNPFESFNQIFTVIKYVLILILSSCVAIGLIDNYTKDSANPTRYGIKIMEYLVYILKITALKPLLDLLIKYETEYSINKSNATSVISNDDKYKGDVFDDNTYNENIEQSNLNIFTTKQNEPRSILKKKYLEDSTGSEIQGASKNSWCYVGNDRGYRSCLEIDNDDTCMSGNIFENEKKCVNINLSNNQVFYENINQDE
jgi:hypothetical protein